MIELKEHRLNILDQTGSADLILIEGTKAALIDLKFSWSKYAPDSLQFKSYVVGIFAKFPGVLTVDVHAIHPFLGEVYCETYARGDEETLIAEVRAVIERARRAELCDYRINKYCGYCGRGTCPLLGEIAHDLAEKYAAETLELPTGTWDLHGSAFKDPAKAAALLKLAGPVEQMASSWRRGAIRLRVEEGIDLPGFKLVIAKGKRSITNAPAAFDAIKDTVTPDEFIGACSVAIGALEDAYASHAPKGKKAAFKAALNDKLTDASAISEGASVNKLVPSKESE